MERIEGLRFRNKLQSTFYNTDEIVTVEYQIIDLFKEDIDNQVKTSNDSSGNYVYTPPDIIPNFKFDYGVCFTKEIDIPTFKTNSVKIPKIIYNTSLGIPKLTYNTLNTYNVSFGNFTICKSSEKNLLNQIKKNPTNSINIIKKFNELNGYSYYISPKDKHLEITHKESFGVKGDFTIDDLCRFSNYCFTKLTAKIVPIKDLQLNNAAMYAHKCPVCNNEDNGAYNIVPVRIVQQCLKEGKEFTRAKCTHCPVNILVYFTDSPPSDYINLKGLDKNDARTKIENINLQ